MNTRNNKVSIGKLFDLLDKWRKLPAYQLERRADIFFALHLEEILKIKELQITKTIIPEFPVRLGALYSKEKFNEKFKKELKKPNQSFKIDYLAFSTDQKTVYLIELKTDKDSRRTKQDEYLNDVKDRIEKNAYEILLRDIEEIRNNSISKTKYDHLISLLSETSFASDFRNAEIIYIQPEFKNKENIEITFKQIAEQLEKTNEITHRFIQSLERWKEAVE